MLEDGDRELVTIIECISADGTPIHPSLVFKGTRRDLTWGAENYCNASISHSVKGWTDQEIGFKWIQRDFEPATRKKLNSDDEYRLLILDGHNSHTTYQFCNFAEKHKIIILCLPPHTTH
ncbi:CENP-B protein [Dendrothele bispora CBS 962.96]|uniref:CENP-B protein n=1 Tax=Dendrothele bispora (strain CBS 962.96) TaxID=1314807 RepID=A0A4S8MVZ3_DENBC|nr:CENP-B protein [Dendrothele bispora CBS 962.96]